MNNQKIDKVVDTGLSIMGEKKSLGRQYMEWLDTIPKIFMTYKEWLFTYHEEEYNKEL